MHIVRLHQLQMMDANFIWPIHKIIGIKCFVPKLHTLFVPCKTDSSDNLQGRGEEMKERKIFLEYQHSPKLLIICNFNQYTDLIFF